MTQDQDTASPSPSQSEQKEEGERTNSAPLSLWHRLKAFFSGDADNDVLMQHEPAQSAQIKTGILNLRQLRIEDVCVPKADIVAVPVTISKSDLVHEFNTNGLTRLPVYNGTLDTPLGFVHLKDLALKHGFSTGGGRLKLREMLRPLLYVPASMPIGVLLTKMQADRVHMALVIDEYGGTDGLVTIEDLIEQVVGEIADEHDIAEDQPWREEKPGTYWVKAKVSLEDFQNETGLSLLQGVGIDGEDVDSLGGLVSALSGSVPARGEVIKHPAGIEFEITEADPRRIKALRVHVPVLDAI